MSTRPLFPIFLRHETRSSDHDLLHSGKFTGKQIDLYPNPTSTELNVAFEMNRAANVELRVMDMTRKLVLKDNLNSQEGQNKIQVATNELPLGMYFLTMIAEDQIVTKRFIVQR